MRSLLTAALAVTLVATGAAFTVLPEPGAVSQVAGDSNITPLDPVPVEQWQEPAADPIAPQGIDVAVGAASDTVLGDQAPLAKTAGVRTIVPMSGTNSGPVPSNPGGAGNFMALPGLGSGSWGTTGQTGGFTWNYPFPIREAPAGSTPALSLSYDSTRLDGLTSATNNQASVVGDGWALGGAGTIRQKFGSCKDQLPAGTQTWDLCGNPGGQEFTISFGNRSGLIIKDANGKFHLQADDNTRLEFLQDTNTANGTRYGDYWKVTDPEGTEYFFGLNKLPGWTSGKATTNSTDYVPVRAATSTQPCNDIGTALCQQAYAWNLDYVVDVHGNSQAFYYTQDLNYYASAAGTGPRHIYVRASRLARVDYGMREGTELTAKAPMQVHLGYTGRCEGGTVCTNGTEHDVPTNFTCNTTTCAIQAPTFYTYYRLQTVISQTLVGASYGNADIWTLGHWMPDPEDGTKPSLWLRSVTHQGADTTSTGFGGWITDPATIFDGQGRYNRVWDVRTGQAPMNRIRLMTIINSTGARTTVNYMPADPGCTYEYIATVVPETNTKRCFPQWWQPVDPVPQTERRDLFNIYPVQSVSTTPSPGYDGSAAVYQEYKYEDAPVWKYVDAKYDSSTSGSKKTWSVFGGWSQVRKTTGNDPGGSNPYTITTYLRGINGTPSNASGGVRAATLTASDGITQIADQPWLAGRVLEQRSFAGTGTNYLSSTITLPWSSLNPTAKAPVSLDSVEAHYTGTSATKTRTASSVSGGWRTTYIANTFDALGRITAVADHGDYTATTADDICTTTSYADNATANILSLPAVSATFSAACNAGAPNGPLLRYTRTLYDTSTSAVPGSPGYVAPTKGDKTRTDAATATSGVVVTGWQTGPTMTYDSLGRAATATDNTTGAPRTTTTTYSPGTGAPTTVTVSNALQWKTVTTLDVIRGNTLKTQDQNLHETSAAYDQSGREIKSWDARRPQAAGTPTTVTSYGISNTSPSWVKKTTATGIDSFAIYDGMGRVRQTQAKSPGGGSIVTDTMYNSAGAKNLERHDYYVPSNPTGDLITPTIAVPASTEYTYDTAGRVATAKRLGNDNIEQWTTGYSYVGIDTTTTKLTAPGWSGSPETTVLNARGKVDSKTSYHGTTATGSADKTTFVYDAFGQRTGMGDGQNLWTWKYDAAGRETSSTDPDTGTGATTYDASGRVATRSDALQTVTGYVYDVLDRVTKQTVTAQGGTAKTLITSTYDSDTANLGQLTSTTRNNGVNFDQPVTTTYSGFDLAYTPGTVTTTLPATLTGFGGSHSFTTTTTYTGQIKAAGTPTIAGLPAETVAYGYTAFDTPSSIQANLNIYAGNSQYDHLGKLVSYEQMDNAESTGTNTTGKNVVSFNWSPSTGRLIDSQASNTLPDKDSSDLGTTRYKYDPAGRITSREQAYTSRTSSPSDYQCYSYDHADRVKAAWTPSVIAGCSTAPASTAGSVTGLTGPAPYAQTYTYTAAGDRAQVKRFSATGALAVTETYAYPAPGTTGPHRLQSVTSVAGSTTSTQSFTWDAAGKMTGRAGQTLTYSLDGSLSTTTGASDVPANPNPGATAGTPPAPSTAVADDAATRFYDASGNLVGIKDGTGTTVTLGSITAHNSIGGTKTATKTYSFAGKIVAQRTSNSTVTGTKLAFIIGDRVNTAQTMTLPNTGTGPTTVITRRTDPLGLARGANGTATANGSFATAPSTTAGTGSNAASSTGFSAVNGYIAGLDDTVSSLTHLGARELDPVLGVFTAPDPILDISKQEGFTPYTYAFGNTINTSDPTGLKPTCDCDEDRGGTYLKAEYVSGPKFYGVEQEQRAAAPATPGTYVPTFADRLRWAYKKSYSAHAGEIRPYKATEDMSLKQKVWFLNHLSHYGVPDDEDMSWDEAFAGPLGIVL
ncbi:RHS repeat-associated core domain-containing protein [Arthrobacter sp. YN]|uniref:RHS repeat-associated core domain-containing protein n=1 Tax=Arthrobacter sp. YN TaxID=2020486 RepID=UPI000B5FEDB0|nr:RHS repeat-associated core domain-containing protein [Arthrobacter sp. YN]ASN19856.1 hypothetical protein CGK93_09360 [Arthrobacter sp. YN]